MARFFIGLLLGLLLGIGGASAFLITAGGGDYLVSSSPRVRELEASLKNSDQDREWLRKRLGEATDATARLESRFVALSERLESLVGELDKTGAAKSAGTEASRAAAPSKPAPEAAEPAGAPAANP
jgi:hypothetical protein